MIECAFYGVSCCWLRGGEELFRSSRLLSCLNLLDATCDQLKGTGDVQQLQPPERCFSPRPFLTCWLSVRCMLRILSHLVHSLSASTCISKYSCAIRLASTWIHLPELFLLRGFHWYQRLQNGAIYYSVVYGETREGGREKGSKYAMSLVIPMNAIVSCAKESNQGSDPL